MVHTKSNPHLIEEQLYSTDTRERAKLRIETKGKGPKDKRPASMFNPETVSTSQLDDYGPLIIDSVVQPVPKRDEQTQETHGMACYLFRHHLHPIQSTSSRLLAIY